jgi:hypothetical protein
MQIAIVTAPFSVLCEISFNNIMWEVLFSLHEFLSVGYCRSNTIYNLTPTMICLDNVLHDSVGEVAVLYGVHCHSLLEKFVYAGTGLG